MPPYLAGRTEEREDFLRHLEQAPITTNLILTGLRGVGKTVLLESFRPLAIQSGWGWVGTDLSESASATDEALAIRMLTDLSVLTSGITVQLPADGIGPTRQGQVIETTISYSVLSNIYTSTPGLASDKLKRVLEFVWSVLPSHRMAGVVFAYDEAQNLGDQAHKGQFPLSLLLDVFQSIQRKGVRFILVLTGLPTLFPKLVEARAYSERMFHQVFLNALDSDSSWEAIVRPIQQAGCPVQFDDASVATIVDLSGGYPYFIQFICREIYDIWVQKMNVGEPAPPVPVEELKRKLDADFFAARWARVTDRHRELLTLAALLPNCDSEFTVQDLVAASNKSLSKPFSSSHVNQILSALSSVGAVYKNRYGKYAFAVPLFGQFIRRQAEQSALGFME